MDEQPIIPLATPEPETPTPETPTPTPPPASPPDPSTIPPSPGFIPPAPSAASVSPVPDPVPPVTPEPLVTEAPAYNPPVSSEPLMTPTPTSTPTPPAGGKHTWVWILVLLLILGGAGGGYYYYKTRVKSGSSGSSAAKPATDPTLSWATFSTPDIPFTLRYPTGWKVADNHQLISSGIDQTTVHATNINVSSGEKLPQGLYFFALMNVDSEGNHSSQYVSKIPVGEATFFFWDVEKGLGGVPIPSYDQAKQQSTDQSLPKEKRDSAQSILEKTKPGDTSADAAAAISYAMFSFFIKTEQANNNVATSDITKTTLGSLSVPVMTYKIQEKVGGDTIVTKDYFFQKGDHVYGLTAILTTNGDKDRSKEVDQIAATLKVQ